MIYYAADICFPFPDPVVIHHGDDASAYVRYGGRGAVLRADKSRVRDRRRGYYQPFGPENADQLRVDGFGVRYLKGRRLWPAVVFFVRHDGETDWDVESLMVHGWPNTRYVPQLVGFLRDAPAKSCAVGARTDMRALAFLRAQAGARPGPILASEMTEDAAWEAVARLWSDPAVSPFDTARRVGLSYLTLWRRFGRAPWFDVEQSVRPRASRSLDAARRRART